MAQNKVVSFGPIALTNTYTTNLLNPGTTTGGVNMPENSGNTYFILKGIHVTNKTAGAVTFRLFKGATGGNVAGTELFYDYSVAANSSGTLDWYPAGLRMDTTDFLVGGASAATSLTISFTGEIGIA